jgi:hypothetical protein
MGPIAIRFWFRGNGRIHAAILDLSSIRVRIAMKCEKNEAEIGFLFPPLSIRDSVR